jgi:predicted lipoprotein
MREIPEEYMNFDFGFTGVSEAEYKGQIENVEQKAKTEAALSVQQIEAQKDQIESELKEKVEDLEKIVMPLLVNLLKTSDKEYIYWPDRKEMVQSQIDKVLAITRG